jgi:hypothetical protein
LANLQRRQHQPPIDPFHAVLRRPPRAIDLSRAISSTNRAPRSVLRHAQSTRGKPGTTCNAADVRPVSTILAGLHQGRGGLPPAADTASHELVPPAMPQFGRRKGSSVQKNKGHRWIYEEIMNRVVAYHGWRQEVTVVAMTGATSSLSGQASPVYICSKFYFLLFDFDMRKSGLRDAQVVVSKPRMEQRKLVDPTRSCLGMETGTLCYRDSCCRSMIRCCPTPRRLPQRFKELGQSSGMQVNIVGRRHLNQFGQTKRKLFAESEFS